MWSPKNKPWKLNVRKIWNSKKRRIPNLLSNIWRRVLWFINCTLSWFTVELRMPVIIHRISNLFKTGNGTFSTIREYRSATFTKLTKHLEEMELQVPMSFTIGSWIKINIEWRLTSLNTYKKWSEMKSSHIRWDRFLSWSTSKTLSFLRHIFNLEWKHLKSIKEQI